MKKYDYVKTMRPDQNGRADQNNFGTQTFDLAASTWGARGADAKEIGGGRGDEEEEKGREGLILRQRKEGKAKGGKILRGGGGSTFWGPWTASD